MLFKNSTSAIERITGCLALCITAVVIVCATGGCSGRTENSDNKPASSERSGIKTSSGTTANSTGGNSVPEYFLKVKGNRPFGVAINNGIMYVVTAPVSGNGMLSKVTPDGKVQEFVKLEGDFSGYYLTDKSFISSGIDFDGYGNVYITLGDKLIKILPDGTVNTIADGFIRCFDVKIDWKGNMYVADDKADTIYMFTPSMQRSTLYKGEVKGDFILTSLALDKDQENLYAREGRRILKFRIKQDESRTNLNKPVCVADNMYMFTICVDKDNTIYACTDNSIIRIDGKAKATTIMKSLYDPDGLCIGKAGFDPDAVYVADASGIVKVHL